MHKVVSRLDDERPQAPIEVVDLCTAMASAGLIVSILKVLVELITEPAQPLAGGFLIGSLRTWNEIVVFALEVRHETRSDR
jgi:hypothetical protein